MVALGWTCSSLSLPPVFGGPKPGCRNPDTASQVPCGGWFWGSGVIPLHLSVCSPPSETSITLQLVGWALYINDQPPGCSLHQSLMYKTWCWKEKLSYTQSLSRILKTCPAGWCPTGYTALCNCLASAASLGWVRPSARGVQGKEGDQGHRHPRQYCNMLLPKALIGKQPGINGPGRNGGEEETVTPFPGRQRPLGARSRRGAPFSCLCRLEGRGLFSSEVLAFSPQKWISNPV